MISVGLLNENVQLLHITTDVLGPISSVFPDEIAFANVGPTTLIFINNLKGRFNMKSKDKVIYWVSTGLLSIMMILSATMYFVKTDMASELFTKLGYPTYIIYPLAIVKILGIIAILSKKSVFLKEWAYAGFFFDFLFAIISHLIVGSGEFATAFIAIFLVVVSRIYDHKLFAS